MGRLSSAPSFTWMRKTGWGGDGQGPHQLFSRSPLSCISFSLILIALMLLCPLSKIAFTPPPWILPTTFNTIDYNLYFTDDRGLILTPSHRIHRVPQATASGFPPDDILIRFSSAFRPGCTWPSFTVSETLPLSGCYTSEQKASTSSEVPSSVKPSLIPPESPVLSAAAMFHLSCGVQAWYRAGLVPTTTGLQAVSEQGSHPP